MSLGCAYKVNFISDFSSKMARTICDVAKGVAVNHAAKAKLQLIAVVRVA